MTTATKTKKQTEPAMEVAKKTTIDSKKIRAKKGEERGELLAVVHYVEVIGVRESGREINVKSVTNNDSDFFIRGRDLVERCISADQYAYEEKVTKTQAAEILVSSHNTPLTVNFTKQEGEVRTMRGRLVAPEPLLGRSHVEDLDIPLEQHRLRLVDHRTINWLIVNNTKYTVK